MSARAANCVTADGHTAVFYSASIRDNGDQNRSMERTVGAFENTGVYPPKAEVETMAIASKRTERMDFMVNGLLFECLSVYEKDRYINHHRQGYELTLVTYVLLPEKQVKRLLPSFFAALPFFRALQIGVPNTGTRLPLPYFLSW